MSVEFTQEAEIKRLANRDTSWELFSSTSMVQALHKARDLGWKDKKVQVRVERSGTDLLQYYVEPFERDCNCPQILKYSDFFD